MASPDAVNTADLAANYNEGKVVIWKQGTNDTTSTTYNIEGKANEAAMADRATMAADSEKLGGQLPAYYAKQSDMDTVKNQIGTAAAGDAPGTGILGDIDSLEQAVNNLEQGTGITQIGRFQDHRNDQYEQPAQRCEIHHAHCG